MGTNQNKYQANAEELGNDCHADRKTVATINKQEGEILLIDNVNYGIRYQTTSELLLPCNLPQQLQQPGKKIIFSGSVKETLPTEMWAGQPFVLTQAEEK